MRHLFDLSEQYRNTYYGREDQYGQKGLFYAHELTTFLDEAAEHGDIDDVTLMMRMLEAGVMVGRELSENDNEEDNKIVKNFPGLDPKTGDFDEDLFYGFIEKNKPEIAKIVTAADLQPLGNDAKAGKIYKAIVDAIAFGYGLRKIVEEAEEMGDLVNE